MSVFISSYINFYFFSFSAFRASIVGQLFGIKLSTVPAVIILAMGIGVDFSLHILLVRFAYN